MVISGWAYTAFLKIDDTDKVGICSHKHWNKVNELVLSNTQAGVSKRDRKKRSCIMTLGYKMESKRPSPEMEKMW